MSFPFKLTLIPGGTDGKQANDEITGEFTDDEHDRLLSFLDEHDALRKSKPGREGFPCQITFRFEEGKGLGCSTDLPDDDTLDILLHKLRPFILKKEPASFERVAGILKRRAANPWLQQFVRELQRTYAGEDFNNRMRIVVNDTVLLNSDAIVDAWLNGREYHRDQAQTETLREISDWLPGEAGRGIFVAMLTEKVKAIHNLACLAALLLGRTHELTMDLYQWPRGMTGEDDPNKDCGQEGEMRRALRGTSPSGAAAAETPRGIIPETHHTGR